MDEEANLEIIQKLSPTQEIAINGFNELPLPKSILLFG